MRRAARVAVAIPGFCACAWFARILLDFHLLARRQAATRTTNT